MCVKLRKLSQNKISLGALELGFNEDTAQNALNNAIENRKFEITMYWHRAAYFWVFIGLMWVALGKVLSDLNVLEKGFTFTGTQVCILFFLTCVGFCLSFAWYLVNKGSKFWQENWELQIAYLEEFIMGMSFAVNLSKQSKTTSSNPFNNPLGADNFSVSKINQLISLANLLLWLLLSVALCLYAMLKALTDWESLFSSHFVLFIVFSLTFFLSLKFAYVVAKDCRSHLGDCKVGYNIRQTGFPKKKG
ncbi:MAG: hypothetical protein M0P99_09110 [Candidatus Cloacimonetes bacterium]|jgi:hypothetical protein|nr:hypothetical protein [Candidatus Cloacimonadota bacterium]